MEPCPKISSVWKLVIVVCVKTGLAAACKGAAQGRCDAERFAAGKSGGGSSRLQFAPPRPPQFQVLSVESEAAVN